MDYRSPSALTPHSSPLAPHSRLLCLSNGHGEDIIAVRIVQELQQLCPNLDIAALPIVGEGKAYTRLGIPLIGSVKTMPSGGFIYMDGRQLLGDIQGGLLQLTGKQLRAIRQWMQGAGSREQGAGSRGDKEDKGDKGDKEKRAEGAGGAEEAIQFLPHTFSSRTMHHSLHPTPYTLHPTPHTLVLAVGDIVPLLFAWWSGANYAFVGTAKSEYYVRDENGVLPGRSPFAHLEHWSGSIYHPWERYFMSHRRCRAVFPRDSLTAKILQQHGVPAFDRGNPMMDRLEPSQLFVEETSQALKILLLPGSRPPEVYRNWELILQAVTDLIVTFGDRPLVFLAAIAPNLDLEPFCQALVKTGFSETPLVKGGWGDLARAGLSDISAIARTPQPNSPLQESLVLTFRQKNAFVILTQHAYNDCLHQAQIAIAMAGTATEQFIGLGKPAIIMPGQGPQFTYAFAEAQSRHFGESITFVQNPHQVGDAIAALLSNPDKLQSIAENGIRRMGKLGAARRIAECLIENF
ncbi:MAG: hypothetical protein N4J56_001517 [Chroococcidiopsis sp. SAG 2025]|uniref:lipid-A-disaccharide synthase-related protein n=1 Tax=Chroococcidiopsis sp. SAG 2025 TaxID=171389 RepID=UPI002937402E|nr:lipid-A-disaccharide synthase-related protein [Chroococcidiopsis sp. SAG 2025]MDV2991863.1 hypothetical protein [Chroococcidiopsis sp. SAG 2025]